MTVRVEALGGLKVSREGSELADFPSKPIRCALLLHVALEGSVGRDAEASFFWRDRDPARARHSLAQTVYELRRELGKECLDSNPETIAATDALSVDVVDFRSAVEEERWSDAIRLYRGPFLGGIHLPAGRAFEAWAERARARLGREYRLACTRRIELLEAEERVEEILALAREWRGVDPLEEEAWHHVIASLARLGRRARALQEYERLEELLEKELEVEPVEKTRELAEAIRAGRLGGDGEEKDSSDEIPVRTAADLPPPRIGGEEGVRGEAKRPGPVGSPLQLFVGAFTVILLSAAAGWWARSTLGGTTVAEGAEHIAVVPFETAGSGVEEFSEGIVNLLSWNLNEVGALRTVSPRSVLNAWRGEGGGEAEGLDGEEVLALAQRLGAGSVLTGSVVSAGPEVRINAELNSVTGQTLARVDAEGPGDRLMELVDTLCIRLLREVWRSREPVPNLRVSAVTSGSIPAIRHYIRGENLFWRSQFDSAGAAFERAVRIDSTFALAHYRLFEARGWTTPWGSPEELEALAAAYRHRDRLPEDARTLVVATTLDLQGSLSATDTMEAYVARNPYDAEGWYNLADFRFHAQKVVPNDRGDLMRPFQRALDLSPTMTRALIHPIQLAGLEDDSATFRRRLDLFRRMGGDPGFLELWPSILWGSVEDGRRGITRIVSSPTMSPRGPLLMSVATSGALPASEVLGAFEDGARRLQDGGQRDRMAFARQWASVLVTYGRLADLGRALEWIRPRDPTRAAALMVEGAVAGSSTPPGLEEALAHLEGVAPRDTASVWLSGLELSRGEVGAARSRIADALAEETGLPPDSPFRDLLRAHRGWARALAGDTVGGLTEMEGALREVGYGLTAAIAWMGRLELMVEVPEERALAIDILRETWGDVEFMAPRRLLLGRALELEGRTEEAEEAYGDALRIWEVADPGPRATLDPARRALGRTESVAGRGDSRGFP